MSSQNHFNFPGAPEPQCAAAGKQERSPLAAGAAEGLQDLPWEGSLPGPPSLSHTRDKSSAGFVPFAALSAGLGLKFSELMAEVSPWALGLDTTHGSKHCP